MGLAALLGLTGGLSMVLAFMNLLPIPALDGGHVVFLLYEMILRRKPSDKILEGAQRVGTLLILSLMAYVLIIKPVMKAFQGLLDPLSQVLLMKTRFATRFLNGLGGPRSAGYFGGWAAARLPLRLTELRYNAGQEAAGVAIKGVHR